MTASSSVQRRENLLGDTVGILLVEIVPAVHDDLFGMR